MSRQRAVLEMTPGLERLTFPGQGGYTIQWSAGSVHFPLECAPSGHLILPCDRYDHVVPKQGGLEAQTLVFQARAADNRNPSSATADTPTGNTNGHSDAMEDVPSPAPPLP